MFGKPQRAPTSMMSGRLRCAGDTTTKVVPLFIRLPRHSFVSYVYPCPLRGCRALSSYRSVPGTAAGRRDRQCRLGCLWRAAGISDQHRPDGGQSHRCSGLDLCRAGRGRDAQPHPVVGIVRTPEPARPGGNCAAIFRPGCWPATSGGWRCWAARKSSPLCRSTAPTSPSFLSACRRFSPMP